MGCLFIAMWKIVKFCSVVGDSLPFRLFAEEAVGETGKSKEEKGMLNLKIEDKNPNIKQELKGVYGRKKKRSESDSGGRNRL